MGVAFVSLFTVEKELQSGDLLALDVSDLHCERETFVTWSTQRGPSSPARFFLKFLESNPLSSRDQ